jgi:cell division protein FtsN
MSAKPIRKKYGAEPKRPQKPQVPGWIWLVTGCLLGAFVMFLLHVSKIPTPQTSKREPSEVSANKAEAPPVEHKSAGDEEGKPRYDFYRLLKENQPPHALRSETSSSSTSAVAPQDNNSTYLLQVASYKTNEEADATRAKLLLLGLTARVEKVTLRNTETWHRVLIGPFKTLADIDRIRSQLTDNKYDALVLKTAQ